MTALLRSNVEWNRLSTSVIVLSVLNPNITYKRRYILYNSIWYLGVFSAMAIPSSLYTDRRDSSLQRGRQQQAKWSVYSSSIRRTSSSDCESGRPPHPAPPDQSRTRPPGSSWTGSPVELDCLPPVSPLSRCYRCCRHVLAVPRGGRGCLVSVSLTPHLIPD